MSESYAQMRQAYHNEMRGRTPLPRGVTLLHATPENGSFCGYCGKPVTEWGKDEPCPGASLSRPLTGLEELAFKMGDSAAEQRVAALAAEVERLHRLADIHPQLGYAEVEALPEGTPERQRSYEVWLKSKLLLEATERIDALKAEAAAARERVEACERHDPVIVRPADTSLFLSEMEANAEGDWLKRADVLAALAALPADGGSTTKGG